MAQDWKTVADCWRMSELWNVKMESGRDVQVRVGRRGQGGTPDFYLENGPSGSKGEMEKGIAAVEAVEAKLEYEQAVMEQADYYTAGLGMELTTDKVEAKQAPTYDPCLYAVIAWMKDPVNWGVDRANWILQLLIALCEDSDGPGADLEFLRDQIAERVEYGAWKE